MFAPGIHIRTQIFVRRNLFSLYVMESSFQKDQKSFFCLLWLDNRSVTNPQNLKSTQDLQSRQGAGLIDRLVTQ